jgi:hypothetical protein
MKKEYKNELGQYHRIDGPAIEDSDGAKQWRINGKLHRTDGPALENNYSKYWFINGKLHREDGPAIEYSDGDKSWYLNDIQYGEEEFHQEVIKLKLKRLIEL